MFKFTFVKVNKKKKKKKWEKVKVVTASLYFCSRLFERKEEPDVFFLSGTGSLLTSDGGGKEGGSFVAESSETRRGKKKVVKTDLPPSDWSCSDIAILSPTKTHFSRRLCVFMPPPPPADISPVQTAGLRGTRRAERDAYGA